MKALITGGNRGIGIEIATMLAAKGFTVHILSRSGIREAQQGIISWETDVADYEQTIQVTNKIGHVDVLVNNAGIMNTKTATDYNTVEILHILHTNLITAVRLSVRVAEQMAVAGGGRIVSIGSLAGEIGHPDIWYGISKAGLANAMRSLARTFGSQGVIANTVAPGPVATDMMQRIPEDRKIRLKSATINQRFCTATEVATTVCWLASDAPPYINGEIFDMNNGSNYR